MCSSERPSALSSPGPGLAALLVANRAPAARRSRPGRSVWIFGTLLRNPGKSGRPVFNAAIAARGGKRVGVYHKRLLPAYDVFDEGRYFEPGDRPLVLRVSRRRVAVTICEDIWNDKTFWKRPSTRRIPWRRSSAKHSTSTSTSPRPRIPWERTRLRRRMMRQIAPGPGCPSCTATSSGATTGWSSTAPRPRSTRAPSRRRRQALEKTSGRSTCRGDRASVRIRSPTWRACAGPSSWRSPIRGQCGFETAVLAPPGGIDSAVTAALACERWAPRRVFGVACRGLLLGGKPPGRRRAAKRLGVRFRFSEIRSAPCSTPTARAWEPHWAPTDPPWSRRICRRASAARS